MLPGLDVAADSEADADADAEAEAVEEKPLIVKPEPSDTGLSRLQASFSPAQLATATSFATGAVPVLSSVQNLTVSSSASRSPGLSVIDAATSSQLALSLSISAPLLCVSAAPVKTEPADTGYESERARRLAYQSQSRSQPAAAPLAAASGRCGSEWPLNSDHAQWPDGGDGTPVRDERDDDELEIARQPKPSPGTPLRDEIID